MCISYSLPYVFLCGDAAIGRGMLSIIVAAQGVRRIGGQ